MTYAEFQRAANDRGLVAILDNERIPVWSVRRVGNKPVRVSNWWGAGELSYLVPGETYWRHGTLEEIFARAIC